MSSGKQQSSFTSYLKENMVPAAGVYVLALAAFGMWGVHDIVTFDAEGLYTFAESDAWYDMWIRVGRWSLVLLKRLLGTSAINPYFSVAMLLVLFPLSAILWGYVLDQFCRASAQTMRFSGASLLIFAGIYVTHPVWAYQFAYRNQLDVIVIPMVLLPVGTLLFHQWLERGDVLRGLAALVTVVFCFGAYQSFLFVFADAFLMELLLTSSAYEAAGRRRDFWIKVGKGVLFTAVAFLLYEALSHLACRRAGLVYGMDYLNDQFRWGSRSVGENLRVIREYIRSFAFGGTEAGIACNWLYGTAGIAALAVFFWRLPRHRRGALVRLVLLVGVWFVPFALEMVTAGDIVIRSQFSFVLSLAFLCTCDIEAIATLLFRVPHLPAWCGRCLTALLLAVAVLPQLQRQTRLLYSDVRAMEQDREAFENIYYRAMSLGAKENDAICFVGGRDNYFDDTMINNEEVIGYSYLEHTGSYDSTKTVQAMRAYGYQVTVPTPAQDALAQDTATEMDVWPEQDSVRVLPEENLIVVRLQ